MEKYEFTQGCQNEDIILEVGSFCCALGYCKIPKYSDTRKIAVTMVEQRCSYTE